MQRGVLLVAAACVTIRLSRAEEKNTTQPYSAPDVKGLHWAETFDGDVWSRWKASTAKRSNGEEYNGAFAVEPRKKEALVGDVGLVVPEPHKHYAVATKFKPFKSKEGVPFVFQMEVKYQDQWDCGGSYAKLFDSAGEDVTSFKDDTRYVIMFGPDRCGATNKVHFILQYKSPKTGKWEEKHCKSWGNNFPPKDSKTHVYGLVINPDNNFTISVDGKAEYEGNLLTSMDPPILPPKEIPDPADSKPADWVDEKQIDEPTAKKPDDWNEDEPYMIEDATATMPKGWVEDAEHKIPDPSAKKPDDWDEDEDGEWEAPVIDNPVCVGPSAAPGCGKWKPPQIKNPKFQGKWKAPKIDNPAYKGEWIIRKIPNPDYFADDKPYMLPTIDSVGFDIWTINSGMMIDNVLLTTDPAKATAFADQTWKVRHELEELQNPTPVAPNPWLPWNWKPETLMKAIGVIVLLVIVGGCVVCCRRRRKRLAAAATKKEDAKKEDKPAETKDETKAVKQGDGEGSKLTKRGGRSDSPPPPKPKPTGGGVGDLGSAD